MASAEPVKVWEEWKIVCDCATLDSSILGQEEGIPNPHYRCLNFPANGSSLLLLTSAIQYNKYANYYKYSRYYLNYFNDVDCSVCN